MFKSEVFTVVKCTVVCVYPECFLFLLPQTLASHLWPFLCVFASLETDRIRNRKVKVAQSCQTLCNPMNYTVHGILQARILEWVAFPFSRGSSQPRDRTQVSHIAGRFFTSCISNPSPAASVVQSQAIREAQIRNKGDIINFTWASEFPCPLRL